MAANMADEAKSWVAQPDGTYLRHTPSSPEPLFSCHRFFMENPSLSGRGRAGARDVIQLVHSHGLSAKRLPDRLTTPARVRHPAGHGREAGDAPCHERHAPPIPLEDAAKARLKRIGVIDVGSNSVRLVVFDGMARSPAYFYNEKVLCGLGAGLSDTGRLSPEGWVRARAALHRFAALAGRMELSGMIAVATAAVREAEDGPAFCDQIERETGLQLHVASGSEEARLAAQGVLPRLARRRGLVCDMGGASMELARVNGGTIHACGTSPLGPLQLADIKDDDKRDKAIRKGVKALRRTCPGRRRGSSSSAAPGGRSRGSTWSGSAIR